MFSAMSMLEEPVVWIFGGIVAIALIAHWIRQRRRKRAWQGLAVRLGYEYMDEDGRKVGSGRIATEAEVAEVKSYGLQCLTGGYHRHVLLGREGKHRILIADYQQTRVRNTNSADGSRSVREEFPRTVVAQKTANQKRPRLLIWHLSDYPKDLDWLSGHDAVLRKEDTEFNERFDVRTDDLVAAERMLSDELRSFLKSVASPGFHLEMNTNTVAIHFDRCCSAEEAELALGLLRQASDLIVE
jgi:hypothetical protein